MSGNEEARRDAESNYRQEVRGEVLSEVNSMIERKIGRLQGARDGHSNIPMILSLQSQIDILIELQNELE